MEKPVAGTLVAEEPLHQPVVPPAAADGAEANGLSVVVLHLEGQLGLEHGAGVVLEAADAGGIDAHARASPPAPVSSIDLPKLLDASPRPAHWRCDEFGKHVEPRGSRSRGPPPTKAEDLLDLLGASSAPFVKSPLSSLRPPPSRSFTPSDAQPVELVDCAQHDEAPLRVGLAAERPPPP